MDLFIFTKEILRRKFSFRAVTDTALIVAHRKSCNFLRNLRNILLKQHLFFGLSATFLHFLFWCNFFRPEAIKTMETLESLKLRTKERFETNTEVGVNSF